MKKIGFIDYYLHEWHADNLPVWLQEETKGEMKVCYAYGKIDSPLENGITNAQWCKEKGIELCSSIQEVVDKSDYLVVLSPDNPEMHEELTEIPLASGKRTYVDKTFAPDRASAIRMIENAKKHNTPMFSSSALRFSEEICKIEKHNIEVVNMRGPHTYAIYAIHQIEPIVALMGPYAERVMFHGTEKTPGLLIQFSNNRMASTQHFGWECPFNMAINYSDNHPTVMVNDCSNYFPNFVKELADFFKTGEIKAPYEETIAVITIREYGYKAMETPGVWVDLPKLK